MQNITTTPTPEELRTAIAVIDWVARRDHARLTELHAGRLGRGPWYTPDEHWKHIQAHELHSAVYAELSGFLRYIERCFEDDDSQIEENRIVNFDNDIR